MLEGKSYVVVRELPESYEQESKWTYNVSQVMEVTNNMLPSNIEEELPVARPARARPSKADQREDNRGNRGDVKSLLIYQIGRDMSIHCLLHCPRFDYPNVSLLNSAFRSVVQSGELYRLRRAMGIVEHWVYFSCELMVWQGLDPVGQRWFHLPQMIRNDCFMCSDKESLGVGTELLVFGRDIMSFIIYKYSILTNTWTIGTNMNAPRCLFGSASLGEIAILAGGCDLHGNILSSAELYSSLTGTWETIPSMHTARKLSSGVFMDGKFYVIGGVGKDSRKLLTSAEVYDLKTRTWTEIPNMSPPRTLEISAAAEAPPLLAVANNELYAADYALMEVRKYDKQNNVWSPVGRLPEQGGSSMNGWGLAFRGCGDRIIVIGGPRHGCGMVEINAWIPAQGPPGWNLLGRKSYSSFVYNCAVMGC